MGKEHIFPKPILSYSNSNPLIYSTSSTLCYLPTYLPYPTNFTQITQHFMTWVGIEEGQGILPYLPIYQRYIPVYLNLPTLNNRLTLPFPTLPASVYQPSAYLWGFIMGLFQPSDLAKNNPGRKVLVSKTHTWGRNGLVLTCLVTPSYQLLINLFMNLFNLHTSLCA